MKFPSKIISYNESILSKLPPILNSLLIADMTVLSLYNQVHEYFSDFEEYIDALDCLYTLNQIEYIEDKGVLHYVA